MGWRRTIPRAQIKKMKNLWLRCGILAAVSFAASAAFGFAFSGANTQPGSLLWNGSSDGYVSVGVSTNSGGSYQNFLTGQFKGSFDPASEGNGFGPDDFFRFFCIDLSHLAVTGPTTYTRFLGFDPADLAHDATDAAELTRLFNQYYPNPGAGTYYSGGVTNFGDFANATDSAAFQLAVWEIWFDNTNNLDLSNGSFRADPLNPVTTQAQAYLTAIGNGPTPAAGWTLYEFVSTGNPLSQNYISVQHTTPLQQTPEPGTLILLGVGALAAWGTSKRHRKTA
jgi:hypothetical protein